MNEQTAPENLTRSILCLRL